MTVLTDTYNREFQSQEVIGVCAFSKRRTITFRYHAPDARTVDIAGSFNNWTLKQLKRSKDGTWKTIFRPKPGTYEYKFLVDHRWTEDPGNPETVDNDCGSFNSVCRVD